MTIFAQLNLNPIRHGGGGASKNKQKYCPSQVKSKPPPPLKATDL